MASDAVMFAVVRTINGASRGFAFVHIADKHELQKAITEMNMSTEFSRKPIKVKMAIPKERYVYRIYFS